MKIVQTITRIKETGSNLVVNRSASALPVTFHEYADACDMLGFLGMKQGIEHDFHFDKVHHRIM